MITVALAFIEAKYQKDYEGAMFIGSLFVDLMTLALIESIFK